MENKLERVFLIDAMSHIFRAYFAPMGMRAEPLRNSRGQVTQAVFVFTNMLRKLLNDERPHYIAAIFDTDAPTFRHEAFEAYKANRLETPDDLLAQIPYIVQVCEVYGIPVIKLDGFEADDIIGTFAKQAAAKNLQAVVVSNDKDMCQLVQDPLIVCMRQNSQSVKRKVPVPTIEWCDEAWVLNKFGVPANKIVDLLGLMGDSVDNIPGAPGIGPVGAIKLIQEFGSVEEILRRTDEIKHKSQRASLENNADLVRQSLELATIKCDVPITMDLEALKHGTPKRREAYLLFKELEFAALTKEFSDAAATLFDVGSAEAAAYAAAETRDYTLIQNRAELDKLIRRLWEVEYWSFAVDDSNSPANAGSFDKEEALGVAIAIRGGTSYYVDFENFAASDGGREKAVRPLGDTLANGLLRKAVHDWKSALAVLKKSGITPERIDDDTLIAAYLLDPTRTKYELASLAAEATDLQPSASIPEGWSENQWRTAEAADFVMQTSPILRKRIFETGLDPVYRDIELPLVPVLYQMEMTGMAIDADVLRGLSKNFSAELERLKKEIYALAGQEFNVGSPKQVGEVLASLNIETGRKTATGQISTSKDLLAELANTYELPRLIIEYREIDKLKSVYTDALPGQVQSDGRIHGKLNQTVAATGRLSSTDPNLQNIPIRTVLGQEIRRAFIPAKGNKLISADYSQLELRILAHVTQDEKMLEAFRNNEDIHAQTALLVFGDGSAQEMKERRRLAKIVNFGIAYAVEAYGLSQRVGLTVQEAKKVIADYFETYKGIRTYMDETPLKAKEQGYISSLFGRRRPLPSINDRNYTVRSRAEREAINMPIQGSASDIVKISMLRVDKALQKEGFQAKLIMQIHDELLLDVPENEVEAVSKLLCREMESSAKLDVPLVAEVGVGNNWMETK
ncbi:MAG TPA: DNA polymerase I [Pyrinomonadaceae bacterium]|jgi:DNA polymerase-1|nr:DNA polymerase I [Pyrinomonadaceae bacterium]